MVMRVFSAFSGFCASIVFSLFFASVASAQTFQVSAYYSPLPNQDAYVSGSYAADLRVNGNGTHGADGTAVYVGMISAPSIYNFGTKIFIPGLGIGTVHDRGGAIFAAKGYHRLDIWMGYGDDGRKRALEWGRQTVEGSIVSSDSKEGFVFNGEVVNALEFDREVVNAVEFDRNLWLHIDNDDVTKYEIKKIQTFLGSRATGYYGNRTAQFVLDFQLKHSIVLSSSSVGAGTWGPKTRKIANILFLADSVSTREAVRK